MACAPHRPLRRLLRGAVFLALVAGAWAKGLVPHVRDGVGLFGEKVRASMESRLAELSAGTGFEVRLEVRAFDGFDSFTQVAEEVFEEAVAEAQHYRVALVLIGIDRGEGRGMVGTNLGAGLFQVMSREDAADLFLAKGEPFKPGRIEEGVDRLASRLEEWHTMAHATDKELFERPENDWYRRLGVRFYPFIALGLVVLWMGYSSWRSRQCPECGATMRTRVRLGGPGGGAVRTQKCFQCGFIKKKRFDRLSLGARNAGRRGTPEA